jgi:hypothetical protein
MPGQMHTYRRAFLSEEMYLKISVSLGHVRKVYQFNETGPCEVDG